MEQAIARDVTAERVRRVAIGHTNAKDASVTGLGGSFRFSSKTNDPFNGRFTIFQIQSDGKYKVVA